jgi:hypothetical protein
MFAQVAATVRNVSRQHPGDVVDLHFIGHSRGTVMTSEALREWSVRGTEPALRGSYVIVTLLDPHPANNDAGVNEDYERHNWRARMAYGTYRDFQASAKDPPIALPAGSGIREIQVIYQKNTAAAVAANPPQLDNLWDRSIDEAFGFWLWGQSGEDIARNNGSGAPIRARMLTRFEDGETVTHSGVVDFYRRQYQPNDPLTVMSPERGNCLPVYRF